MRWKREERPELLVYCFVHVRDARLTKELCFVSITFHRYVLFRLLVRVGIPTTDVEDVRIAFRSQNPGKGVR